MGCLTRAESGVHRDHPGWKTVYVANIGRPCPRGAYVPASVTAVSTAANTVVKTFAYGDADYNSGPTYIDGAAVRSAKVCEQDLRHTLRS